MNINESNAVDAAVIQKRFGEPFPDADVKLKPAVVKNNRCLALRYIDARAVMDRLDAVVGVDGWQDAYAVLPSGEVECRLSVKVAGEWITKADVGGQSEQHDDGDKLKAAFSDALKRAAVKWGIGRYLYRLPQEWMDYDPVKKQIIRPANSAPAPRQQQQQPKAVEPSVSKLCQEYRTGVRDCRDDDAMGDLMARVQDDIKAGNLPSAEVDLIRADIKGWKAGRTSAVK